MIQPKAMSDTSKQYMNFIIEHYGYTLTVNDLCEILGTTRRTIDIMIHTGNLPVVWIGKRARIPVDEFVKWSGDECMSGRYKTQVNLLHAMERVKNSKINLGKPSEKRKGVSR